MPTKEDHLAIKKATVYDLEKLIEKEKSDTLSKDEIKTIMDAYIAGAQD